MTDLATLRFFRTPAHACSYLEDRQASTLFVDPQARVNNRLYSDLSRQGFRRSGDYLYRPYCDGCSACVPVRVRTRDFVTRRRHRRIWRANEDLQLEIRPARFTREIYRLYARYIEQRHGDGDMYPPSEEQFNGFLMCSWGETRFFEFRRDQKLVAVAVVDVLDDGLSAVYTFFDPEESHRSPGTLAVLWQIEHARDRGLPYLYLGYWIRDCNKMNYKDQFQPLEHYRLGNWSSE